MIIRSVRGQVYLREATFEQTGIPPAPGASMSNWTGKRVTASEASGLPVVGQAMKLVSEGVGMQPLITYDEQPNGNRSPATKSWQYDLLLHAPCLDCSPMNFYTDVTSAVLGFGNAFVHKLKARGRVVAMELVPAGYVVVKRDRKNGEKQYSFTGGYSQKTLTDSDIIHVRGYTIGGGDTGLSPIQMHRNALGVALSQEQFAGTWFTQGGFPGVGINMPKGFTIDQAREWLDDYTSQHIGIGNQHKPMVLPEGATLTKYGMSLEDAQFVMQQEFSISEVARIFNLPVTMLKEPARPVVAEDERRKTLTHGIQPYMTRIEQAFHGDADLFGTTPLRPMFDSSAFLRADTAALGTFYTQMRQIGVYSQNDVRQKLGEGPIEGGDEYLTTPVGGAPDLQPGQAPPALKPADAEDDA